ncbi:DUF58 domain-containing protein [Gimesia algae]|uniref:DUF58 domain-containing protein n=1 Tax=Gimesia algae TaxID=2527971 RepID=A0A517VKV9_9PLAN|nr:DUF58 domain-containing protein [Gimesia algae]QDT93659.1 hypothetical protein Pan161_53410 [Gimesia algae]
MRTDSKSPFLELKALAALEHMRFSTRHRIEGTYSGRHQSRQRGGAGEFADYREYTDGEDLRRLDWKVMARTGKAYVRLFQDEKNLLCTLAIDASASMKFGSKTDADMTGSKLEYSQYLATALSHVICRGQDQVGLAIMTDQLQESLSPGSTPGHVAHIQELIEQIETVPETHMSGAMQDLFEQTKSRGVLMLLSDFLVDDLDELFAAVRLFRHRQSEVIILHLIHPDEERLPAGTAYRFEGLENEGSIDCSPAEIQSLYQQRFQAHSDSVRTLSLTNGCDYLRVSTAIPYLQTLGEFLVERTG